MNLCLNGVRHKAVWGPGRILATALVCVGLAAPGASAGGNRHARHDVSRPGGPNSNAVHVKIDKPLTERAKNRPFATSKVIVLLRPGYALPAEFRKYATDDPSLDIVNGRVLELPNQLLKQLSNNRAVLELHFDRPLQKENYRTALTTGARAVQQSLGFTGLGVGVAVID